MSKIIDKKNINKKNVDSLKNNQVIYSSDLHKDALLTPQKSYKKEEKYLPKQQETICLYLMILHY